MDPYYSRHKCHMTPEEARTRIQNHIMEEWKFAVSICGDLPQPLYLGLDKTPRFRDTLMAQCGVPVPQRPMYILIDRCGDTRFVYGNVDWLNGYKVFYADFFGQTVEDPFALKAKAPQPA